MSQKPTAAFVLSIIGGVLILIGAIVVAAVAGIVGGLLSLVPFVGIFGGLAIIFGVLGLVFAIAVMYGAVMINSGEPQKVRTGSILVLAFSILSLITGGGFVIGLILGLIGGILGIIWKPAPSSSS